MCTFACRVLKCSLYEYVIRHTRMEMHTNKKISADYLDQAMRQKRVCVVSHVMFLTVENKKRRMYFLTENETIHFPPLHCV
jgi:ribosomal 50S subunit-associated protein YjgA (DUF615 family)